MELPVSRGLIVTPYGLQYPIRRRDNDTGTERKMYKRSRYGTMINRYGTRVSLKRKYKKFGNKGALKSSKAFKQMLKRYQKPEAKIVSTAHFFWLNPGADSDSTDCYRSYMFPIPTQGSSVAQRIGNDIQVYGVTVKLQLNQASTPAAPNGTPPTTHVYTMVRVSLIYDKTPGGNAITTPDKIFQDNGQGAVSQQVIDPIWRKRFKVIRDWTFELDGVQGEGYNIDKFVPLKITQQFGASNSSTSWTDLRSGGLMLVIQVTPNAESLNKVNCMPIYFYGSWQTHYIDV